MIFARRRRRVRSGMLPPFPPVGQRVAKPLCSRGVLLPSSGGFMKRFSTTMIFLALALPMAAQNAAPAAPASTSPGSRPVAAINGEVITADKLNALWATVSPARREQYEKNGG